MTATSKCTRCGQTHIELSERTLQAADLLYAARIMMEDEIGRPIRIRIEFADERD